MMSWQSMRSLRQDRELDPFVLLIRPNHLVDDVNIERQMSSVYIFWDYLDIVLLSYFIFILHVYLFVCFYIFGAPCDYGI